ncbi:MAG TPA: serine hydrolase [Candidatus Limnocylindria bacterium]|jgi:beta-lactamase class A|nr:serine hydrolase [Candidatus Limnocylindria bacterium]
MTALLDRFADRARAAGGRVGAVVLGPDGSEALALDADGVFFSASVIKLPLVMTLYADAALGRSSLAERVEIGERVDGSGVLRDLRDVERMSLRDLAALAMTVSDNTATNRLIERVGVARVNERLDEWGCRTTRIGRAMFDLEAKARGVENLMTPRETASLLARVAREAAGGIDASVAVLGLLERNTSAARLGLYLPKGVTLGHKDGWGDDPDYVDNDAGIVRARSSVVAVGFTYRLPPLVARPLLGLLGLGAAELAGADIAGLPLEMVGGA